MEFCFQLRLLSKAKNTWTSAGGVVQSMRHKLGSYHQDISNPLLLGVEGVALLRQILVEDGLIIREILRELSVYQGTVTRDMIAENFEWIVERAVEAAGKLFLPTLALRKAKEFLKLIRKTKKIPKSDCKVCKGTGKIKHLAAKRASLVLNARKAQNKNVLYNKLLDAGRLHPSASVIGSLSGRMSGRTEVGDG